MKNLLHYTAIFMAAIALSACGGDASNGQSQGSENAKHLSQQTKAAATNPYSVVVQQLYVAYFGRPADPGGLVNFEGALAAAGAPTDIQNLANAYNTNPGVKTLIDSFGLSSESQVLYGGGDTKAFVTAVFQNVLGRAPATAGLTYWVNAIDSGQLTQSNAALSIMAGAESNTTTQGLLDAALVNNRLMVAASFTSSVPATNYSGPTAAASARAMLATVTNTTDVGAFQTTVAATVSAINNEHVFESFALHGGESVVYYYFPYGGGNLVAGTNYIYSFTTSLLTKSPYSAGSQTYTPVATTLDNALAGPGVGYDRILQNGQLLLYPSNAQRVVTYVNGNIHLDYLAMDGKTILTSAEYHDYSSVPLTGMMANAPEEFMASVPVADWINFNNFSANAQWQAGAAYMKKKGNRVGTTVFVEDCYNSASPTTTNGTNPTPCLTGGTLDNFFPINLGGSSHPYETDFAGDGAISTIQGVRMWVANSPVPLARDPIETYRVFYESNGNVYQGYLEKDGAIYRYNQADGSVVDYSLTMNQAAIDSIRQGIVTGVTVPGSKAGSAAEINGTVDLFGIGGHGVNGTLSSADLRTHYAIPANLDGSGQTIALIDAPGSGDVEDDLSAFSQFYNLPLCTSANSCFKHIDFSNGTPASSSVDWGSEVEIDTQMAHAIAPGAKIVLVTAASNSHADLMAAVIYAGNLPGVTTVSMSFGNNSSSAYSANIESQLQSIVTSGGPVFFASSGDGGYMSTPQYPSTSMWVTGVGGTRINSVQSNTATAEAAWQYSGGGISSFFSMPAWQANLLAANQLPIGSRSVPDVAAVADNQHSAVGIYYKQSWRMAGGTSVAAPIWAGIGALFAQHLSNAGTSLSNLTKSTPGGFNGVIYNLQYAAQFQPSTVKASGFFDIVSGSNNLTANTCTVCVTSRGYDYVTGLGAPNVTALFSNF